VIDIVETVGGMPLAIEIAAGWVRLLPPEEIARDLHHSIALLEGDPDRGGDLARPEHASLRAVLDQAWGLLSPAQREVQLALSVFVGGFTHAAARAAWPLPETRSRAATGTPGKGRGAACRAPARAGGPVERNVPEGAFPERFSAP
jgi:hypothetical protein